MKILCNPVFVPLILIPGAAMAADAGRISAVVLYPGAAAIERVAKVATGERRVELTGLPATFDPQTLRVEADCGIQVTEVAIRDEGRAEAISRREAELEAKIQALTDQKSLLDVDAKSAELARDYLARLSGASGGKGEKPQAPALDPQALAGVIDVINRSKQIFLDLFAESSLANYGNG